MGSVKRSLKKVIGNARLTFQELETVLTEIEGNLNNRPLTYEYSEVVEEMLTPNHLIHGRILGMLRDEAIDGDDDDLQGRLEYLNKQMNHFWNRWQQEYLVNLREYHKCNGRTRNVEEENDIVLVHEDHVPRVKWKLAKVIKLIPGPDSIVRSVKIEVGNIKGKPSVTKRPLEKLYSLEIRAKEEVKKIKAERGDRNENKELCFQT